MYDLAFLNLSFLLYTVISVVRTLTPWSIPITLSVHAQPRE